MTVMKRIPAAALALLWFFFAAGSAGASEAPGAQIWMNRAFRFGSYDFRIIKVEWLSANGYLVPLGQPDPDGKGALVLTTILRNLGKAPDHLPSPDIQVVFKDGARAWKRASRTTRPESA